MDKIKEIEPRNGIKRALEQGEEDHVVAEVPHKAEGRPSVEKNSNNPRVLSFDRSRNKDKIDGLIDFHNVGMNTSVKRQKESEQKGRFLVQTFTPGLNLSNNLLGQETEGRVPNFFSSISSVVEATDHI